MEGIVSVIPNRRLKLHTTRSWDFMGLTLSKGQLGASVEGDVVIGLLDTGIYLKINSMISSHHLLFVTSKCSECLWFHRNLARI